MKSQLFSELSLDLPLRSFAILCSGTVGSPSDTDVSDTDYLRLGCATNRFCGVTSLRDSANSHWRSPPVRSIAHVRAA